MSDQDLRHGLRWALADEPAFDVDAMVDRAGSSIARRRRLMLAAAGTFVIAGLVLVLPLVAKSVPRDTLPAAEMSIPQLDRGHLWLPDLPRPARTDIELAATMTVIDRRMGTLLAEMFPESLDANKVGAPVDVSAVPVAGGAITRQLTYWARDAWVEIQVRVLPPGSGVRAPEWICAEPPNPDCGRLGLIDGRTQVTEKSAGGSTVYDYRPDGVVVAATSQYVPVDLLGRLAGDPAITY
ncbi:MAG TPA: hypothetical protein VM677_19285 [Actinokineospora sp.]|jgi:hypothetical protein|nr:hypothetical protein [Actinokineospora sp.]